MKHFPRDTLDPIEQIYAPRILRRFPRYGEFWRRFIGVKNKGDRILPYGLRIPHSIPNTERREIRRAYEKLTMAHYSLFCHLAGAHFQANGLSSLASSPAKWFRRYEAFDCVYVHLGSCLNQVHHLWNLLFLLRGQLRRRNRQIVEIPGRSTKKELTKHEFKKARKLGLLRYLNSVRRRVKARRDNIVHYAREASVGTLGTIRVPLQVRPNVTWSMQLRKHRRYIRTRHGFLCSSCAKRIFPEMVGWLCMPLRIGLLLRCLG
jgi:hypothetical protein